MLSKLGTDDPMSIARMETQFVTVQGVRTELLRGGRGQPAIFLHPGLGLFGAKPFLDLLTSHFEVIVPSHPGFGHSELPQWMSHVDDLAYFHLDLLRALDVRDAILIGGSFGGWIASEMAIKSTMRIAHLLLVDALGIKVGDRESRDIADIYALPRSEVERRSFVDPANKPDFAAMGDEDLAIVARNCESEALFGWSPYMHNPKLHHRLARIERPTSVLWGESDGIVGPDYGRAFAAAIPGAEFHMIKDAAHHPHIEQPRRLFDHVMRASQAAAAPRVLA
jgi:pimeloyl-ACP methyl ester carboxylesterase